MTRRPIQTTLVFSLVTAASASAGPVLLATYEFATFGGAAPATDPRVQFILQLPGDSLNGAASGLGVDNASLWASEQTGLFDFSSVSDAGFDEFAHRATNGIDESAILWTILPNVGGRGIPITESILFGSNGDLFGNSLLSVRLVVEEVLIEPWIPFPIIEPELIGFRFETQGRFEFYGVPIPEPSTLCLLSIACVSSLLLRHRKSRGYVGHVTRTRKLLLLGLVGFAQTVSVSLAQCVVGGTNVQLGLNGGDLKQHDFPNQCLAASGTNVTIRIEALADLGCYNFDGTHDPGQGQNCPEACTPICCDTDPALKYVTVSADGTALTSSISGSVNIPLNGRFFEAWNGDCDAGTTACLEAGRSPCFGSNAFNTPNRRIVTIPASTWNGWVGTSGGSVTFTVTASAAVGSAPMPERSLRLYCENLGFQYCPFQGPCPNGMCGADAFTRVTVLYCLPGVCDDGDPCTNDFCSDGNCSYTFNSNPCADEVPANPCTNDVCSGGECTHPSNSNSCADGIFCNGTDQCSGGTCSIHNNNVCIGQPCCEVNDSCGLPCAPVAAAPSPHDRRKNRYLSFTPNNAGATVAFRVRKLPLAAGSGFCSVTGAPCTGASAAPNFVQGTCAAGQYCIAPYFSGSPGGSCWVDTPIQSGVGQYTAQCVPNPVFRVWTEPVVHVADCEIIPVAEYEIYTNIPGPVENPTPLAIGTILLPYTNSKLWGDIARAFSSSWPPTAHGEHETRRQPHTRPRTA